jgi:hypothetical protein
MSPSCGFATESTIPETRRFAVVSRRCMIFSRANMRVVALIGYLFESAAARQSQKLRSVALRLSFAIRLGSVLGFAGVVW